MPLISDGGRHEASYSTTVEVQTRPAKSCWSSKVLRCRTCHLGKLGQDVK